MRKNLPLLRAALLALLLSCAASDAKAQRHTDRLDRGLVAVPATSGNLVSWRIFGEEYYDVTYNLYCNGTRLATGLKVSNYLHTGGVPASQYQVAAVVRGVEQPLSTPVTRWENGRLEIPVQPIPGRNGQDATALYTLNDVALGDLDGDGISEFIVKRPCSVAADVSQQNSFHVLDAYDHKGNRLWWIDLGPNMLSGADEQWDCICFDWDQDGKAEVILRGADNMVIHHADGTTTPIGSSTVDTRWNGIEYTSTGNEYLLYLEGATGKPYAIGEGDTPLWMSFPNPRGLDTDWGTGIVGHRSTKHYFAAPFLDGRKASLFLGRGAYTKHQMKAFDIDPSTHRLTQRWAWECSSPGPWFGQGYHNFQVADVDWDGRDEIVFGSMVIDDNGFGLSTTGLGHGDAQHCSDFDPYRHGQEQFACNESSPNNNYRNATTSEIYYRSVGTGDDGRALMGNFTNDYPGSTGRSVGSAWISSVADREIPGLDLISWADLNQRIYWDGDLCDEYFDSPGTEGYGAIYKPATASAAAGRWNFPESKCNNYTKNNPGAIGDIFGDWREELVMRKADNTALLVYTTPIPTTYRIPTLWHDHQYRNAMVWQSIGYNQPPHKSYFLGELEGITQAPPPLTLTGRREVGAGAVISTTEDHLLVCADEDLSLSIANGASPYILTFNVSSHVQGTAPSHATSATSPIVRTAATCTVTGGGLAGSTRLVKQGDGTLILPATAMNHTGNTDVWAGTLRFDGALPNSPLWLNRFATLQSHGGSFRKIVADYGATVEPVSDGTPVTLTADTLCLGFGSQVNLTLYPEGGACDRVNLRHLVVERKTSTAWEQFGPARLMPVLRLSSSVSGADGLLPEGDYVLGTLETIEGQLGDLRIEGARKQQTELRMQDGHLLLSVRNVRPAARVYWTGSESNVWDHATTPNFNREGEADVFVVGDQVTFDDAAVSYMVSLADALEPDTVWVTGSKTYNLGGTGRLSGNATLVKEGTGTLVLATENDHTGRTILRGGTLRVSSLSNANHTTGNLGLLSSSAGQLEISNGAILQNTAAVTMGSPLRLITAEGGVLNTAADFNLNAAAAGTRLTKKGPATLNLYVNNPALDTLAVAAGTASAAWDCITPAKAIELQGGTLALNNSNSTPLYVPRGKAATVNYLYDRGSYANRLTGAGTVSISYPLVKGSGWNAERCRVTGNWSAFEGTVKPLSTVASDGRFCLDSSTGLPLGTMHIASGVLVQNTGKAYTIGQVTGEGILGGVCTLGGSVSTKNIWTVGRASNFTFAGQITGDGTSFVKQGEGKMTFTGTGDFTGTARVSAGELALNHAGTAPMLGTGALTVVRGATLSGRGVLANSSVTVAAGAVLRSGVSETATTGNLQFSEKNVTVNGTAQAYIGTRTTFSRFTAIGTLRLNGTLVLKGREGLALPVGTEVRLFEAASIVLGSNLKLELCEPNAALGLTWDTSRLASEGVLVVADAPVGIQQAQADVQPEELYTLQGVRCSARSLPNGVYIRNGVKTLPPGHL